MDKILFKISKLMIVGAIMVGGGKEGYSKSKYQDYNHYFPCTDKETTFNDTPPLGKFNNFCHFISERTPRKPSFLYFDRGWRSTLHSLNIGKRKTRIAKKFFRDNRGYYKAFDRTLDFEYNYQMVDESLPLVVIMGGLNAHMDNKLTNLYMAYFGENKFYNTLIIEPTTSSRSVMRNVFPTLGGVHESYHLERAINWFFNHNYKTKKNKKDIEIILVGSSASTYGTYFAQNYMLEKNYKLLGSIQYATWDDMGKLANFVCHKDLHFSCPDKNYTFNWMFEKFSPKQIINAQKKLFEQSKKYSEKFAGYEPGKKYSGWFDVLDLTFMENRKFLEKMSCEVLNSGKDCEQYNYTDLFDYYQKIAISKYPDKLKIPTLFIHSEDDLVADFRDQLLPILSSLKGKENAYFYILKDGGHGGYHKAYGKKFLEQQVRESILILLQRSENKDLKNFL